MNDDLAIFKDIAPPSRRLNHAIDEDEIKEVLQVLESGLLSGFVAEPGIEFSGGPKVREFEEEFADYFGTKYAVTFNSATSALHGAVAAAGVGAGDEVITSPYSMTASASCVVMQSAVPVFCDVEMNTFCLDPEKLEDCISKLIFSTNKIA